MGEEEPETGTKQVPPTDANVALAEKRVDVALAEFNALRAELVTHLQAGNALLGVGLTALAVLVGFVVKDDGDPRLLLAVPPLATIMILLQAANTYRVGKIGIYIQQELWPFLKGILGDDIPDWELAVAKRSKFWSGVRVLVVDAAGITIFLAASIVALSEAGHFNHGLRDLGWSLITGSTVIAALLAVVPALRRRKPRLAAQRNAQ